ncbi:hypothetical protein ACLB2K_001897 [Fragaria x ananassa]
MATYRALLSLKSSLDDPRREQPLTLADLTLSNLTLAENNLSPSPISPSPRTTSPVPSRLRSPLSALRLLNLSNNFFNRTFLPELSNLINLRVLDLYNNNLTGVLPVSVANMTNLRHLHLGGRKFSRKFLQFFFSKPSNFSRRYSNTIFVGYSYF